MSKLKLLDLRPTQFVLGMREVEAKKKIMKELTKKGLKEYQRARIIPIILGPGKEPFLIDHHHYARACWELGIHDFKFKILKDKSDLHQTKFWNYMTAHKLVHLYDQFGLGPHTPYSLPVDIRCLGDDPFRSLVWELIFHGHITKVNEPFAEFAWTAYLRFNLRSSLHSKSDFRKVLKECAKLVRRKDAAHLPGYKKE